MGYDIYGTDAWQRDPWEDGTDAVELDFEDYEDDYEEL